MNNKVLHVLEYNKIIDQLTDKATSEQGKKLTRALVPMTDQAKIAAAQTETADALGRLFRKGSTSFGGNKDLGMCIKSLEIGSVLSIAELLRIASFLENVNRIKTYGRKDREDTPADSLDEYFDILEPLTPLVNEIRRCILSEEEIADDA
ncbi:MAG: endonuclease MutS2, partial [Lachnospiraceae bacterium]|nr:endonuclease MutS2 [Lachnospiraceae bacterium]